VATDASSRRRLNEVMRSLSRFSNNRRLDVLHAARSGIPLRLAAYGVLGQIVAKGPTGLSQLGTLTQLQPAALSRHVRELEGLGYIERSGDPKDGRVSVVRATSEGRFAHRRIRAANDELLSDQLLGWTSEELNHLSALMERLDADLRSAPSRSKLGPTPQLPGERAK
jgi:DNA-binding MarR family transcriptional regulator